jgi:hypothetical protein
VVAARTQSTARLGDTISVTARALSGVVYAAPAIEVCRHFGVPCSVHWCPVPRGPRARRLNPWLRRWRGSVPRSLVRLLCDDGCGGR